MEQVFSMRFVRDYIREHATLLRFIIVGGALACIYILTSFFLQRAGLSAFVSSIIGYILTFTLGYFGQKIFSFRSQAPHSVAMSRYAALQVICCLSASVFAQILSNSPIGNPTVSASVPMLITGTFSYLMSKKWVFKD